MDSFDPDALDREIERTRAASQLDAYLGFKAGAHRALSNVRQPWRSALTYRYVESSA